MLARRNPPSRLAAVVAPVYAGGLVLTATAVASFATAPRGGAALAGLAGMLAAASLADRYPVPLEGSDTGGVSLLFVFCVAGVVLFGWQAGVVVGVVPALLQMIQHRPPVRVLYNASVLAIAGAAAGVAAQPLVGPSAAAVVAAVGAAAVVHYLVNLALISAVVSVSSRKSPLGVTRASVEITILPFGLMASAALILVVLWQRAPLLSAALVGPLLAIALYQRSRHNALRAMRLALTDPLTGLGNHRHFHDRLERELDAAREHEYSLSLLLVDVDDFKRINDRFGHPGGDRVLAQLATRLRQGGEAFRLGGDEFAILLPGRGEAEAVVVAQAILERLATSTLEPAPSVTVSAGVATTTDGTVARTELVHRADSSLYWAKEYGKNRVRAWRPDLFEPAELQPLVNSDRSARFRAAAGLARAVDARDAYTGSHSERVGELAARLARRLGLDQEQIELTRLAGNLHDLGKLAIPEEILRKPGPLTEEERHELERHPRIGFRMLESLDVEPIADWVLHHHERWDGAGYPDGVPAAVIPVGARIIFVADAYDAMTSDRVYRSRLSSEEALAELVRCAGSQFDPTVVAALADELETVDDRDEIRPDLAAAVPA